MKVLIADDTKIIRDRLVRQVSPLPGVSETIEAHDFSSTIKYIERYQPDALLLDMFMPGGTGLDVLRYLKDKNIACHTIVLTSSCDENLREMSLAAGAEHYLLKGADFLTAVQHIGDIADAQSTECH